MESTVEEMVMEGDEWYEAGLTEDEAREIEPRVYHTRRIPGAP